MSENIELMNEIIEIIQELIILGENKDEKIQNLSYLILLNMLDFINDHVTQNEFVEKLTALFDVHQPDSNHPLKTLTRWAKDDNQNSKERNMFNLFDYHSTEKKTNKEAKKRFSTFLDYYSYHLLTVIQNEANRLPENDAESLYHFLNRALNVNNALDPNNINTDFIYLHKIAKDNTALKACLLKMEAIFRLKPLSLKNAINQYALTNNYFSYIVKTLTKIIYTDEKERDLKYKKIKNYFISENNLFYLNSALFLNIHDKSINHEINQALDEHQFAILILSIYFFHHIYHNKIIVQLRSNVILFEKASGLRNDHDIRFENAENKEISATFLSALTSTEFRDELKKFDACCKGISNYLDLVIKTVKHHQYRFYGFTNLLTNIEKKPNDVTGLFKPTKQTVADGNLPQLFR